MTTRAVRIARIYLTEADQQLNDIMQYLHDNGNISGATVYRGIEGYGASGKIHESSLLDLSFNLPITLEFFDESSKVLAVIEQLQHQFNLSQIISWLADQH